MSQSSRSHKSAKPDSQDLPQLWTGTFSTSPLGLIIGQVLSDLGIDKTIHGFRHHFITCLVRAYGGDLLIVAQYSRHRSLEVLQVYNDNIKRQDDLPRFYKTFEKVRFTEKNGSGSHNYNYQK